MNLGGVGGSFRDFYSFPQHFCEQRANLTRVDAAIESRPDWVIETCRAEEIMDSGGSKYYEEAMGWLAKARDAYLSDGRIEEWQAYFDELIDLHRRKYKLRPMLEDLGRQ